MLYVKGLKMKKIILMLLAMISILSANMRTLDAKKLQSAIEKGVAVIDIRRVDEWNKTGIIKGSYKLTFFDSKGKYNAEAWMNEFSKIVKNKNDAFVLVCAHANRTKVLGKFLNKDLGYSNVYDLEGGIMYGWIDKGLKTVKE